MAGTELVAKQLATDAVRGEHQKKNKKRGKYFQISVQSFPLSVLVLRLEPFFSDPLLEILKKEVRGHKRERLIETCRLDEAFVISEAHTVGGGGWGVHRAGSLGISFTHCDLRESQCQVAPSFDGTGMCHAQKSKGEEQFHLVQSAYKGM